MSRKLDLNNLGVVFGLAFVMYLLISFNWFINSDTAVSEGTIGMYEYRDACIEEHGSLAKCNEPIERRKESRDNFYKFQLILAGSAVLLFGVYKVLNFIYPAEKQFDP